MAVVLQGEVAAVREREEAVQAKIRAADEALLQAQRQVCRPAPCPPLSMSKPMHERGTTWCVYMDRFQQEVDAR